MTELKCLALFLSVSIFSCAAIAEDNIRNGNPCLSGICVGDEISTLTGIKWKTATFDALNKPIIALKMTDANIKRLLDDFAPSAAASVMDAAPYLHFKMFDSQGIPKLAKVKGFCQKPSIVGLSGSFVSDSGHETTVFVNVVPGTDPSSQALRITQIQRTFPKEYTSAQISELSKQLEERYREIRNKRKNLNPYDNTSATEPFWEFVTYERKLSLYAPLGKFGQVDDQLKQYPGCGKSLKID